VPDEAVSPRPPLLYQQVAARIESMIDGGTLRPGQRIPSVRRLSRQLEVSISTVLEAYRTLEDRRVIEARPQSGYYVRHRPPTTPAPDKTTSCTVAAELEMADLVLRLMREASQPGLVPLGASIPSPRFFPTKRLNRMLGRVARTEPDACQTYGASAGSEALRLQVARRLLDAGCSVRPDEIIITAGTQEAVYLCLSAVTEPGDTVLVESPTYYCLLQVLESLHLKALEIATDPEDGICLDETRAALARQPVVACVLGPTFGNPLGHCMSDERKRELVEIVCAAGVPIIEDDVYGELAHEGNRPKALKAYDEDGSVLLCSSFSKTLAPGYRVGWAVPGRHYRAVERLKHASSIATASPTQLAVARFLEGGGFDHVLRRLRRTYRDLMSQMSGAVVEHFPPGTRMTRPRGGQVLWVELAPEVDSLVLHEQALRHGLSIAPGPLFSATGRYTNFIRLNCALPWTPRVEEAIRTLGRLAA